MNLKNIILFIVSIVLLGSVVYYIGINEVISAVKQASPELLAVAVIINFAEFLVWNLKFKLLVDKTKKISYKSLFPVLMAGVFINNTTPGARTGGGPVKAYFLSKILKKDKSECFAPVILDKTTNTIAFFSFIIISILFVFLFLDISGYMKIIFETFILVIAVIVVSGIVARKRLKKKAGEMNKNKNNIIEKFLPKIYYFSLFKIIRKKFHTYALFEDFVILGLERFIDSISKLARDRKLLHHDFLLAVLIWLLIYLKTYVLFLSVGYDPGFMTVVIVVTLSIFLSSFMIVPGGIGAAEMSMIALYSASGVVAGVATMVSIVDRFIFYFFALGLGYVCLMYVNVRYGGGGKDEKKDLEK